MSKRQEAACGGVRRDGTPCKARPLPGKAACWAHDPELQEKRATARRTGGLHSSGPARLRRMMPSRLNPVAVALEGALEEVHGGVLEPPRAQAMAALARALVAVLSSGELEERLRVLENIVKEGARGERKRPSQAS